MFTKIKDGIQFGIGIVIVLAISGITYASYNALTAVESGDPLTKDSWNQMITNQADFDGRLNNVVNNDYVTSTSIIDDGNGNIGIGTLSPTEKLDVNGVVKANDFQGTLNGYKMIAKRFGFSYRSCGDNVNDPCTINISAGNFSTTPICTISLNNSDATCYTENMVIKSITTTTLNIWRGNYQNEGTTIGGNAICVGL